MPFIYLINKHRLKRLPPFRYTFSYCLHICNKRKIFFCPKESIFTPLENDITLTENACTENITKEEQSVFRDMQFFIAQKWPPNCSTLSFLGSCPTNISNISSQWDNKKCFLRKESFLTEKCIYRYSSSRK